MNSKDLVMEDMIPSWERPLHMSDTNFKFKIEDNLTGETILLTNSRDIAFEYMTHTDCTISLFFSHGNLWWRVI